MGQVRSLPGHLISFFLCNFNAVYFSPNFPFCFAGTSWEFVTNFSCAFVVTALPMRRPLILEASTALPVCNIYPALSLEKVNAGLAFCSQLTLITWFQVRERNSKSHLVFLFLESMRIVWHQLSIFKIILGLDFTLFRLRSLLIVPLWDLIVWLKCLRLLSLVKVFTLILLQCLEFSGSRLTSATDQHLFPIRR